MRNNLLVLCSLAIFSSACFSQEVLAIDEEKGLGNTLSNGGSISNLKLGFVNFRRIMGAIPQLRNVQDSIDAEFVEQGNKLSQVQQELETMENEASIDNGNKNYDELEKMLIAKRREVAKIDASLRDNYSVRRNEELAKLQRLVLDQILAISKENGYDVILNDTGVIYVSPRADLTNLVITRMIKLAQEKKTTPVEMDDASSK